MKQAEYKRVVGQLNELAARIIRCKRCPRLRRHCEEAARKKPPRYRDWEYWTKPLPGFGDPNAKLLIIGLAPAKDGGNRTGRMFCGDSSGDWLIKALYKTGFANQPISVSKNDGLRLASAYITATVRCAPPANKPKAQEIANCSEYLTEELRLLRSVKVVFVLGRVAFESYLRHVREKVGSVKLDFRHGGVYKLANDLPILVASYHPSRQNTQTGRLTWRAWIRVLRRVRRLIDSRPD